MNALARGLLAAVLSCCAPTATAEDWEECQQAKSDAEDAASGLASAASRLESCAENEDFSDDCSTELRRVRSAHSDYESATSNVQSYCDDY